MANYKDDLVEATKKLQNRMKNKTQLDNGHNLLRLRSAKHIYVKIVKIQKHQNALTNTLQKNTLTNWKKLIKILKQNKIRNAMITQRWSRLLVQTNDL